MQPEGMMRHAVWVAAVWLVAGASCAWAQGAAEAAGVGAASTSAASAAGKATGGALGGALGRTGAALGAATGGAGGSGGGAAAPAAAPESAPLSSGRGVPKSMKGVTVTGANTNGAAVAVYGQDLETQGKGFEVATVKPANRNDGRHWFGTQVAPSGKVVRCR